MLDPGRMRRNSLCRLKVTLFLLVHVLIWPHALPAQHTPPSTREVEAFAERARSEAHIGRRRPVPTQILKDVIAMAPDQYDPCDQRERQKLDARPVILRSGVVGGLAIQGRGFCYCSATGNCAFWIYQRRRGMYRLILETDMVQTFGFLKSRTHGYPDLVTWSHGSATERGAELFRFDGAQYTAQGGWGEEYEYLGQTGQTVTPAQPRITSHFSDKNALPLSGSIRRRD